MSRTSSAVLAYGLILTPEELNRVPWGDSWDWDIQQWAESIGLTIPDQVPYCHLFAWDIESTGAVIGSSTWPILVKKDWNRPPSPLPLNFNITPDPVFQNFVAEHLPFVQYIPNWFLFSVSS